MELDATRLREGVPAFDPEVDGSSAERSGDRWHGDGLCLLDERSMFDYDGHRGLRETAEAGGHTTVPLSALFTMSGVGDRSPKLGDGPHSLPARLATIPTSAPAPTRRRNQLTPATASSNAHTPRPTTKAERPTS